MHVHRWHRHEGEQCKRNIAALECMFQAMPDPSITLNLESDECTLLHATVTRWHDACNQGIPAASVCPAASCNIMKLRYLHVKPAWFIVFRHELTVLGLSARHPCLTRRTQGTLILPLCSLQSLSNSCRLTNHDARTHVHLHVTPYKQKQYVVNAAYTWVATCFVQHPNDTQSTSWRAFAHWV